MFVLRLPSIGTVSSCSPLIPIRPLLSASPFPLFSFLICAFLCVSFVVSSCRLARASRFVRLGCVVSSVLSVLPVRLARRSACRLDRLVVSVWRRSVLLFARSRLVCRGGLALRSRAVLVSHWHPVCPSSRSSSCRSVPPAVSSCSSRSRSSSRSRRPVAVRIRFHVRSRVRTVPPCCSLVLVRSSVPVPLSSSWGGDAMRHEATEAYFFSSHPSHLVHTRYSLVADRDAGRMWICGAVPCCSPLIPYPLMPSSFLFIPSVSIVLSLRSLIPSSTKQDNGVGRRTDGGWRKTNEENETHGRDG